MATKMRHCSVWKGTVTSALEKNIALTEYCRWLSSFLTRSFSEYQEVTAVYEGTNDMTANMNHVHEAREYTPSASGENRQYIRPAQRGAKGRADGRE